MDIQCAVHCIVCTWVLPIWPHIRVTGKIIIGVSFILSNCNYLSLSLFMYFDNTSGGRDLAAIERALLDVSFQTSFICREPTLNNIYTWQVIYLGTLETSVRIGGDMQRKCVQCQRWVVSCYPKREWLTLKVTAQLTKKRLQTASLRKSQYQQCILAKNSRWQLRCAHHVSFWSHEHLLPTVAETD